MNEKSSKEVKTIELKNPPSFNILEKEAFLKRVSLIFQIYEDTLSKTLGAYGSPTIISSYPEVHVTKDGFTVCRNMECDPREGELIDQTISLMIMDICSRLNYSVGDGTTTAIVAANELFKQISNMLDDKDFKDMRPKDIINILNEIKDEVVAEIEKQAIPVTDENMEEVIRKIVHISSNGDDKITDMIVEAYTTLGFPRITCVDSNDNKTTMEIIEGFDAKVMLGDNIYINNDEKTAKDKKCDVIMFDHKVTMETYSMIIKPLTAIIRALGRHLICIAPSYDNVMLKGVIKRELQEELKETKDICLVLTAASVTTDYLKKSYSDLAIILGTTLIDPELEDKIIEAIDRQEGLKDIRCVIDISDREIPGIGIFPKAENENGEPVNTAIVSSAKVYDEERKKNCLLRLGFSEEVELGEEHSIFRNSYYDKELYMRALNDAERDLKQVINKFAALGTYSRVVYDAQKRLASIKMQMAKIYVGGESELSKRLLKDSIIDSIRAAESAFQNGFILGCNVTTLQAIRKVTDKYVNETGKIKDSTEKIFILNALNYAFKNVYSKVLGNAFPEHICYFNEIERKEWNISGAIDFNAGSFSSMYNLGEIIDRKIYDPDHSLKKLFNTLDLGENESIEYDVFNLIIERSIHGGEVFDLDKLKFSKDVINSSKTDVEILTATIDLLSLLMVGNQVVMAAYNHMKNL